MAKKKTGVAIAGVMAAAAVAVSSVGGQAPSSDDTFAGSVAAIEEAVDALVDKSGERGMTLPETPGINDVTVGMDGMAPTKGTTRTVRVSSGGSIAKGDYLKVCEELVPLQEKSFASGVKIVAVASNGKDGIDCQDREDFLAAILYTKSGNTNLRVVKFGENGSMTFSNTLTIVQGSELEYADMAFDHDGQQCFIVYNKDGDGWMSRIQYTAGTNHVDLTWSDRWRQGGDPQNICVAYDSFSDFACVCSTALPEGSQDESKRYAVLEEMHISAAGAVISPTPYPLTVESCPCLYGIDYSTAPTNGGWDISYATNWQEDLMARRENGASDDELTDEDVAAFIILISYPKAEGGGRGLIAVDHNAEMECHVRNYAESTITGYSSEGTVAIDVGATTSELGYVAMTDVVHSAYIGLKHYLFIETYGVQKEGTKPVCYMRGRPEEVYETPLENISYALMRKECAIGYTVDGAVYVQIHELQRAGSVFGPAVKVADIDGYAGVVPVSDTEVACIYVDGDGDGRIATLHKTRVAEKENESMAAWAVGTALESGAAGDTIRADLNYWPDEKW